MKNRDLQELPKFEDRWSYLYFEKGLIDQHQKTVGFHYLNKVIPIPLENLCVLMLGPGITITHEAVKRMAESRCLIVWVGQMGVRLYSWGSTGTYSSRNLLEQVKLWSDPIKREFTARRMYQMRFEEDVITSEITIEELRGKEGARVRQTYARLSELFGVEWKGRSYDQKHWNYGDPVNRALSAANSCLYGIVHAGILACGFSPAIGFIHSGKQLSFVYDIADLYKTEITIPIAFETAKELSVNIEREVRYRCRDKFKTEKILKRIISDLKEIIYGSDYDGEFQTLAEGRDLAISYEG